MKFDNHIVAYLYQHKTLSLKGIGEFNLDSSFKLKEDGKNDYFFPEGSISFTYQKNTITTPEFFTYLKQHFTKPVSLIASDVEDYLLQIINLINIGEKITIEGLGTLYKQQNGTIAYYAGKSKVENIVAIVEALSKRETQFDTLHIASPTLNKKKLINTIVAFIAFILVVIGTWLMILFNKNKTKQPNTVNINPNATTNINKTNEDTIKSKPIINTTKSNDTVRYKMYFLATKYRYKADSIYAYYNRLTKINRDSVVIKDTLRHRLFIFRKATPKDTIAVKKKLAIFFNHAIIIE